MNILKQSTAVDVLIGPFVDSTDGYTAETGVSPAVKLSKNGQALAAKNDVTTPVHDADGYYNCELDATDTNTVGTLVLTVVGSSTSLPVRHEYQVVEEAIYDSLIGSSAAGFDSNQRVNVGQWLSQAVTLSANNRPDVNIDEISDDLTAPANLELDYDGTGYNKSNSTIGTCTTNSDMRGTDSALLASSAPSNFGDLAITVTTGQVTVGTNNDKSGYSISGTKTTLDALNDVAATDIVSGGAITTSGGAVSNVTLVATTTTNTDMRGTDSAATAANLAIVDTVVDAIKVKTDNLTFTQAGIVDSNIQYVNDVQVAGTGASGDEWGPV